MKRMKRFCCIYNEDLKHVLDDTGLKYEWSTETPGYNFLIFNIDVDKPEYERIMKVIEPNIGTIRPVDVGYLEFTKKELDSAEWLTVRPLCLKIENYDEYGDERFGLSYVFCPGVGRWTCVAKNRYQPMFCRKPIKWGRNHYFYGAYECGYTEMFCSDAAKKIFHENYIPVVYEPLYNRKMEVVPDVHHMIPLNTLPNEAFDLSGMDVLTDCNVCGTKVYFYNEHAQLKIDRRFMWPIAKVYGTHSIFGSVVSGPLMIISQEVRQIMLEHKMERGLEFIPVVLF